MITVVIPVYNVEEYLDRCVSSVVNQTYTNLEILLIDDGSPDKCPQMCDEWAEKDSRIRVIHKKNAGLGMARNTGIENATGEYICFFDSDDYVAADTIEKAHNAISDHNADVAIFGLCDIDSKDNVIRMRVPAPGKDFYCGEEIRTYILPSLLRNEVDPGQPANLWMSVCICLYSLDLIRRSEWCFASEREIISEDTYALLDLYKYVERVAVIKEALYFVYQNGASVSRSYRSDRFDKLRYFYQKCIELCQKHGYTENVEKGCAIIFTVFTLDVLKMEVAHASNLIRCLRQISEIINDSFLQSALQKRKNCYVGMKQRILYWAMRHKCYLLCYLLLAAQNAINK